MDKMNGNKPHFTKTIQGRQHFLNRKPQPFSDYLNLGNSWLEILVKLSSLLAILGIVLGGFISFGYLSRIDYLSIFPDVISSPEGFLAILFVFFGAISLIFVTFALQYLPIILWGSVEKTDVLSFLFPNDKFKTKIFAPVLVLVVIISFLSSAYIQCIWLIFLVLLLSLVLLMCYFYFQKEKYRGRNCDLFVDIMKYLYLPSVFTGILAIIIPYILFNEIIQLKHEELSSILPIVLVWILFFVVAIANSWIAADSASNYKKGESKLGFILAIPLIFTFFVLFVIPIISSTFSTFMLKVPRFVETPINSQWYLLHNNFQKTDGSQEINGINTLDLKIIKEHFKCTEDTSKNKEGNKKDKPECDEKYKQYKNIELRSNALYGYMAWNLGQTKIFCPPSADNRKGEGLSEKCLVINGNLLQPLPKAYIGADSTPDKGNWSINMNQKMNVLIREAQPESCTDRCVIQQ